MLFKRVTGGFVFADSCHFDVRPHSRICAGQEFANASAFIAMAMIIAAFDISKAKDEFGNDVEIPIEYTTASGTRFVAVEQMIKTN